MSTVTRAARALTRTDVHALLHRDYQDRDVNELLNAPTTALAGVSEADAEALRTAFNIRTVGDLGRSTFFRAAAALADLATDLETADAAETKAAEQWLDGLDPTAAPAQDARHMHAIRAASDAMIHGDRDLREAVSQARAAGDTWAMIGLALGVSRQAAAQRFGGSTSRAADEDDAGQHVDHRPA